MAKKENNLIKEADEEYNVLTGDEEKKRLEWIRMVSAMEEHSALLTAKNEGVAEGKKEIAKKLLKIYRDMSKKFLIVEYVILLLRFLPFYVTIN